MAFRYRKGEAGSSTIPAKDYPFNSTYAATAKVGDVVRLNGSQELVLATTSDTNVAGVLVGYNFEGLGMPLKTGKVITSPDAVYEVDYVGGTPAVGTAYGINGTSQVDVADTTVTIVKVVKKSGTKVYARITAVQL